MNSGGMSWPATLVRLDLAQVLPQRLRRHPQISSDMRDRPARLEHQSGAALQQLHRVLPGLSKFGQTPMPSL